MRFPPVRIRRLGTGLPPDHCEFRHERAIGRPTLPVPRLHLPSVGYGAPHAPQSQRHRHAMPMALKTQVRPRPWKTPVDVGPTGSGLEPDARISPHWTFQGGRFWYVVFCFFGEGRDSCQIGAHQCSGWHYRHPVCGSNRRMFSVVKRVFDGSIRF